MGAIDRTDIRYNENDGVFTIAYPIANALPGEPEAEFKFYTHVGNDPDFKNFPKITLLPDGTYNFPEKIYLLGDDYKTWILTGYPHTPQLQEGWFLTIGESPYEVTKFYKTFPNIVNVKEIDTNNEYIMYTGDDFDLNPSAENIKLYYKTRTINNETYNVDTVLGAGVNGIVFLLANSNNPENKLVLKISLNKSNYINDVIENQINEKIGLAKGYDSNGNQAIAYIDNCTGLIDQVFEREGGKEDLGERIKIARNMLIAYNRFQDQFNDDEKPTHRDISPKNFLINVDTKACVLFDFGYTYQSKIVANSIDKGVILAADVGDVVYGIWGGVRYIAPEMIDKKHLPDPTSDYFSLGMMLAEILGTRENIYDDNYNYQLVIEDLKQQAKNSEERYAALHYNFRVDKTGETVAKLALGDLDFKDPLNAEILDLVHNMVKTVDGIPMRITPEEAIKKLEELQIKYFLHQKLNDTDKVNEVFAVLSKNLKVNQKFFDKLEELLKDINLKPKDKATLATLLAQLNSAIYDQKLLEAINKKLPYFNNIPKEINVEHDKMPFSVLMNDKNQAFIVLTKPIKEGQFYAQNLHTKEWVKINIGNNLTITGENTNILEGKDLDAQFTILREIAEAKEECESALNPWYYLNLWELARDAHDLGMHEDSLSILNAINSLGEHPEKTPFKEAFGALQIALKNLQSIHAVNEFNKNLILKNFISASIQNELDLSNVMGEESVHGGKRIRIFNGVEGERYAQFLDTHEWVMYPSMKSLSPEENVEIAKKIIESFNIEKPESPKPKPSENVRNKPPRIRLFSNMLKFLEEKNISPTLSAKSSPVQRHTPNPLSTDSNKSSPPTPHERKSKL